MCRLYGNASRCDVGTLINKRMNYSYCWVQLHLTVTILAHRLAQWVLWNTAVALRHTVRETALIGISDLQRESKWLRTARVCRDRFLRGLGRCSTSVSGRSFRAWRPFPGFRAEKVTRSYADREPWREVILTVLFFLTSDGVTDRWKKGYTSAPSWRSWFFYASYYRRNQWCTANASLSCAFLFSFFWM